MIDKEDLFENLNHFNSNIIITDEIDNFEPQ